MQFFRSILLVAAVVHASSSWSIDDATISVTSKTSPENHFKDKLSDHAPLSKDVLLGPTDTLKILLTATEGGSGKRPHQAFLMLGDETSGLEASFPLQVKDSGKGKVELTQKDLPIQLLASASSLRATLVIASFGTADQFINHIFNLKLTHDANAPQPTYEPPLRYGQKPVIKHIFKEDPTSGPVIISLFFVLVVAASLPVLFGAWAFIGANLNHLPKAFSAAPMSYLFFFGSVIAMEGIFYLYYSSWRLYQVLPAAGVVGSVGFLSGIKALSEVQSRRLAGQR